VNDGVNTTPEQAARSLRVVRLVSFCAAVAVAALVLLGIAAIRYTPLWPENDAPLVAVVSEMAPAPQVERAPPPPQQLPEQRNAEPREAAAPQPAPVAAPTAPSEPVVIANPIWVERPRNPERFYPRQAFMQGIAGEVVLQCEVDIDGRMSCVVASETPEGQGFGEAALRIAAGHVMRPATQNGAPSRGRYRMVVPFSPAG
jgi:protein TonB